MKTQAPTRRRTCCDVCVGINKTTTFSRMENLSAMAWASINWTPWQGTPSIIIKLTYKGSPWHVTRWQLLKGARSAYHHRIVSAVPTIQLKRLWTVTRGFWRVKAEVWIIDWITFQVDSPFSIHTAVPVSTLKNSYAKSHRYHHKVEVLQQKTEKERDNVVVVPITNFNNNNNNNSTTTNNNHNHSANTNNNSNSNNNNDDVSFVNNWINCRG